jgi:hypothetical protein
MNQPGWVVKLHNLFEVEKCRLKLSFIIFIFNRFEGSSLRSGILFSTLESGKKNPYEFHPCKDIFCNIVKFLTN